jgi:hypothetical protein
MEINEYPRSPLQSNRAMHIKPSGQEQRSMQIDKSEHTIIKGEIVDLRYQEVKIRIEPSGQIVNARISGEVPLSIGQTATFVVSDESDGQITLRYISTSDTPLNDIIHKALYASGLTTSERNLAIVQELLNFQMPVDKNTILQLIKQSSAFPDTNLTTLVLMHKNHLEINISNIAQFESYQMGVHQILSQLNLLIDNISSALINEVTNIDNSDSSMPNINVSDKIIASKYDINSDIIDNNYINLEDMISTNDEINTVDLSNTNNYTHSQDVIHLYRELLAIIGDGLGTPSHITPDTSIRSILLDNELIQLRDTLFNKMMKATYLNADTVENISSQLSSGSMSLESLLSLVHDLFNNELINSMSESSMLPANIAEAFIAMSDYLSDTDRNKLIHLLKSNSYHELITEALHSRWTLSPKELTPENKVKEFFKRLDEDMEQLKELTNNSKLFNSQNIKAPINKLQDNLQFMRDLNELFLYLQLPMRLTQQDAHGDLYVFTRKNQKHSDKENLNVLLHLNMANLGAMDIHMSMKNRQVNTVFYLDKSSEVIISKHLHELIQTLSDKGYQLQAKTKITDSKPDFIIDILQQDAPNTDTHRYSFDIRA